MNIYRLFKIIQIYLIFLAKGEDITMLINFQSIQNTSMPIDLIDSDSGLPIALVSYLFILMIVKLILPIITRGNV